MTHETDTAATNVMMIRVSDSECRDELAADLLRGDCAATPVGADTLEVVHPSAHDRREALTELTFFVRAWQARRPGLRIDVT